MSPATAIRLFNAELSHDAVTLATEILRTSQLAAGSNVGKFEGSLSGFLSCEFLTSAGEMSTAIQMCLFMAGVRPESEVIASPMACLATNIPILNLFANVTWCDIDPVTGNMDPEDLRRKISPRTKAVLVFHWAGNPAPLDEIYSIARANGVPTIEDASEALGAEYQGNRIGNTGGDFCVFSFYPNRHLSTIEGAAISFANQHDMERARRLRRYGIEAATFRTSDGEINPESDISEAGWNSYLNNVAATVGTHQLTLLADKIGAHRENGLFLDRELADLDGVKTIRRPEGSKSAYWVYTFLAERRDDLRRFLNENGVQASKVHLRNDLYSCFGASDTELRGVDAFSNETLSVPCGSWVSVDQREYIVDLLKKGW